jgi:hypothetical protein
MTLTLRRGQAHLPDPETVSLGLLFYVGRAFNLEVEHNVESLEVRKAGLPPLLSNHQLSFAASSNHC